MRTLKIMICVLLLGNMAIAQDTTWTKGGTLSVNFSQTSFNNWAAGGENSVALNSLVNLFAKYKKNRSAWDNTLDMGYGLIKPGVNQVRKSDDKIDFLSKYGYDATNENKWFYTALLNFKSQFTEGFEYQGDTSKIRISNFAAPAYVLFAIGMDYKQKNYSVFLSPLTAKWTIVNDDVLSAAGAFGVDSGSTVRSEFGAYLNARFQKDVMTNVNLMTKLDLFSNYTENPQNIDVNWELLLAMKINKFLTASINTQLIYDHDITIPEYRVRNGVKVPKLKDGVPVAGPRTQFREVLAVGLSVKF